MNCEELLKDIITTLQPLAESKHVALLLDRCDPDIAIQTDHRAVQQILLNLANNALKFTNQGEVRLAVQEIAGPRGRTVTFSVADTGIGIREEDQSRLFQAFTQVGSDNERRYEGTGLGLHLSQKLAELLRGQISFESVFGQRSTFRLMLPQA